MIKSWFGRKRHPQDDMRFVNYESYRSLTERVENTKIAHRTVQLFDVNAQNDSSRDNTKTTWGKEDASLDAKSGKPTSIKKEQMLKSVVSLDDIFEGLANISHSKQSYDEGDCDHALVSDPIGSNRIVSDRNVKEAVQQILTSSEERSFHGLELPEVEEHGEDEVAEKLAYFDETDRFPFGTVEQTEIKTREVIGVLCSNTAYSDSLKTIVQEHGIEISMFSRSDELNSVHFGHISKWVLLLNEETEEAFLDSFLELYFDKPTLFLCPLTEKSKNMKKLGQFLTAQH